MLTLGLLLVLFYLLFLLKVCVLSIHQGCISQSLLEDWQWSINCRRLSCWWFLFTDFSAWFALFEDGSQGSQMGKPLSWELEPSYEFCKGLIKNKVLLTTISLSPANHQEEFNFQFFIVDFLNVGLIFLLICSFIWNYCIF